MTYNPNPLDKTEPVSGRRAATAATEFRELKGLVQKTLRMPEDSAVNPTLPTIAQRANKLLSFDAAGNPVAVAPAGDSSAQLRLDLASTAAGNGASLVGFKQAGVEAAERTVASKLCEGYSVFDAGARGDNSHDDTAAQNGAVTYVQSTYDPVTYASASPANGPSSLFYPAGYYRTTGTIFVTKKVAFKGDGPAEFSSGSRIVQFAPASDLYKVTPIAQGMSVSFEGMTLIGVGTGAGHLINVEKGLAACNSQRYYSMVFGTPPALAMNLQAGDDIIIDNCLFDVSAQSAIALGTGSAANAVSNVRISNTAFFAVNQRCILAYNIDGLQIVGAQVYPSGSGRTNWFIDGYNTLPYKIKDVSVLGGNFKSVDCLVNATGVSNLKIENTSCSSFGAGAGATRSGIELTGTCVGVSITGNTFSGSFDTRNFYNDSAANVTQANITGNTFINNGGTGPALVCGNTHGVIANNTFVGFSIASVSESVTTTGGAVSPGVINALSKWDYTATVMGARQGDRVEFGTVDTNWPVPIGVEVQAFVSAPNTVTISYRNVTANPIGVPAHDVRYCVLRGV